MLLPKFIHGYWRVVDRNGNIASWQKFTDYDVCWAYIDKIESEFAPGQIA